MKKTIAILGVDGAGKSSTIDTLASIYGSRCTVTYMGYKGCLEDPSIMCLQEKSNHSKLDTVRFFINKYRYFLKKYQNAIKSQKLAIFDRYIHDIFINASGRYKTIDVFLFKVLFPKPKLIVYLHCSVEESLKRKDDIADKEAFVQMKQRTDNFFLKKRRKGVICIDTGVVAKKEVINTICERINAEFGYVQ